MNLDEYRRLFEHEEHYWWFVGRRRLALRLLSDAVPSGRVLDLGCGAGALLTELPGDYSGVGVDRFPQALTYSRSRGLNHLVMADGEALPFKSGAFDAVVALDVLEHIEGDERAIAECFRLLRPGGALVLSVPAFRWLWGPHDVALMHFRRYTRREVVARLRGAGFRVERASYSVFALFPAVMALRFRDRFRQGDPEVRLPEVSPGFNRRLIHLMDAEAAWIRRRGLPWGSSVVAVGRKP